MKKALGYLLSAAFIVLVVAVIFRTRLRNVVVGTAAA